MDRTLLSDAFDLALDFVLCTWLPLMLLPLLLTLPATLSLNRKEASTTTASTTVEERRFSAALASGKTPALAAACYALPEKTYLRARTPPP